VDEHEEEISTTGTKLAGKPWVHATHNTAAEGQGQQVKNSASAWKDLPPEKSMKTSVSTVSKCVERPAASSHAGQSARADCEG